MKFNQINFNKNLEEPVVTSPSLAIGFANMLGKTWRILYVCKR